MKLWQFEILVWLALWILIAVFTGWLLGAVGMLIIGGLSSPFIRNYWYRKHPEENPKKAFEDKGKALKAKYERGKQLTPEETKFLKNYLGPVWFATLKKKEKK